MLHHETGHGHLNLRDLHETVTGVRLVPDQDGDFPVKFGGAIFYVRVINPSDAIVAQAFSVALAEIPQLARSDTAR